jgi:hypothetical protein
MREKAYITLPSEQVDGTVETIIGQFVGRFNIQEIRVKDLLHLAVKVGRKILAHTMAFFVNLTQNPGKPLQLQAVVQTIKTCTQRFNLLFSNSMYGNSCLLILRGFFIFNLKMF